MRKDLQIFFFISIAVALQYGLTEYCYSSEDIQFAELEFPSIPQVSSDSAFSYPINIENLAGFDDSIERINMSCGCTRVKFSDKMIASGAKAEFYLEIKNSSVASFRIERAIVVWKSGRMTKVAIAKKGAFGIFISETSLILDAVSCVQKKVLIYLDDQIFSIVQKDSHLRLTTVSTTGAVKPIIGSIDNKKRCIVLLINLVNPNLKTDIIRVSLPSVSGSLQGFILCKIQNNKI